MCVWAHTTLNCSLHPRAHRVVYTVPEGEGDGNADRLTEVDGAVPPQSRHKEDVPSTLLALEGARGDRATVTDGGP